MSISTPAEITFSTPQTDLEDPDQYSDEEPYSELLLETLEAAERIEGSPMDVRSSESANSLFADLLDNWQ